MAELAENPAAGFSRILLRNNVYCRSRIFSNRLFTPLAEDGLWLSQEHDGVFRIGHCGDTLCGRLIGMKYEGDPPKDVWGHPQCGLLMLTGFKTGQDQRWTGHILDPESGHVYDAKIWSPIPDILKLRGFVLGISLFGETQTWTRYRGAIGANCKLP